MKTKAAVTTGKGSAAISCVTVVGARASEIVAGSVRLPGGRKTDLETGALLLAEFLQNETVVDQVVLAREEDRQVSINCHGNPIIIEKILETLKSKGVELVEEKSLIREIESERNASDSICIEAKTEHIRSKTLEGAKIILAQCEGGLKKTALEWQRADDISIIKKQCNKILSDSVIAKYIIDGVKIIIAGAPNSGKSTLLNQLCGREKAIVTDVEGTTRDWISAKFSTESLWMEIFDTAGLDSELTKKSWLDKESQITTLELVKKADLILFMIDTSKIGKKESEINQKLLELRKSQEFAEKPVLAVLNKIDITKDSDINIQINEFDDGVEISSKTGENVSELIEKIREVMGIESFKIDRPVCFTVRQKTIIEEILAVDDLDRIKKLSKELICESEQV